MSVDKFGRFSHIKARHIKGERGPPGQPGLGFKLSSDGHFDIEYKRLRKVGMPVDSFDAITKDYFQNGLEDMEENFSNKIAHIESNLIDQFKNLNEKIINMLDEIKQNLENKIKQLENLIIKNKSNLENLINKNKSDLDDFKVLINRKIRETEIFLNECKSNNEKISLLLKNSLYIEKPTNEEKTLKITL